MKTAVEAVLGKRCGWMGTGGSGSRCQRGSGGKKIELVLWSWWKLRNKEDEVEKKRQKLG